ncbi:MAG: helix-hairpin-helix domain-containing protein [Clostridia bacterium]|nr:helix-hairpin-helix domain-containing protein [Clostridia bacterium]
MPADAKIKRFLFIPVVVIIVSLVILADNLLCNFSAGQGVVHKEEQAVKTAETKHTSGIKVKLLEPSTENEELLDLNTATADELDALWGVGKTRAEAIVKQREIVGGFLTVKDIMCVRGIGPALLLKFEGLVTVSQVNNILADTK